MKNKYDYFSMQKLYSELLKLENKHLLVAKSINYDTTDNVISLNADKKSAFEAIIIYNKPTVNNILN